jgi:CheY-like chemotaxis protein
VGTATILVVDDLQANRQFLATLLRHHGHRVIEAADGDEGLATVRAERPDLVITDVLMPVVDGYEFVRRLRLDPNTRGTPVVFHTAYYGEGEARALARTCGVSDVLTKPVDSARVLRVLARVLAGTTASQPAEEPTPLTAEFDRGHIRLLTNKLSETVRDLDTANARLSALMNIGLEFGAERDADRRLQRVCASVRELFAATHVTLGIVGEDGRIARLLVTRGSGAAEWVATDAAAGSFLAQIVDERRTLRGENPGGDPSRLRFPVPMQEARAFLAVPIMSADHAHGWICLVRNSGEAFSADDEQMVTALTTQIGRFFELERKARVRPTLDTPPRVQS